LSTSQTGFLFACTMFRSAHNGFSGSKLWMRAVLDYSCSQLTSYTREVSPLFDFVSRLCALARILISYKTRRQIEMKKLFLLHREISKFQNHSKKVSPRVAHRAFAD
jgi:hypothetical protein